MHMSPRLSPFPAFVSRAGPPLSAMDEWRAHRTSICLPCSASARNRFFREGPEVGQTAGCPLRFRSSAEAVFEKAGQCERSRELPRTLHKGVVIAPLCSLSRDLLHAQAYDARRPLAQESHLWKAVSAMEFLLVTQA